MPRRSFRGVLACVGLAGLAAGALTPIARAAESAPVVRYIALGDSFTAAPLSSKPSGTPGGQFGFDGDRNPYTCGQSNTNYPRLIARWLGLYTPLDEVSELPDLHTPHPQFIDISCGGAKTEHLRKKQTAAFGYGTNQPQFSAFNGIDRSAVKLVTLGIGGNDLGFGELQGKCVEEPHQPGGSPCRHYYETGGADGGDLIRERLRRLRPKLNAALRGIRDRAPNAKILVFGYPALLPQPRPDLPAQLREGCYPYIPVLPEDAEYLREAEEALNRMIKKAAKANRASYVDWYTPSEGHDMCQPPGRAWVNGIVLAPPSIPVHPNVLGSAGGAQAGIEVLTRLGVKSGGQLGDLGVP